MAIPIKYSYSGADCRAVAFYSSVDDYAYNQPKEGDAFFTFTTTDATTTGSYKPGRSVSFSSAEILALKNKELSQTRPVLNDIFDAGFFGKHQGGGSDAAYMAGQEQRSRAIAEYDKRFKGKEIIPLDSLATISYSIYEAKSPVRRLGERGVSGYTRSIRTIAGSMVFLVIEDHPLSELIKLQRKSKNWSFDINKKAHSFRAIREKKEDDPYTNFVSTLLEPFNIGLFYKTEVGFNYDVPEKAAKGKKQHQTAGEKELTKATKKAGYVRTSADGAHLVISGIDIISEGMVTSVNDMVTEVTMQFVAQDVFNIEKVNYAQTFTRATKRPE